MQETELTVDDMIQQCETSGQALQGGRRSTLALASRSPSPKNPANWQDSSDHVSLSDHIV